MLLRKPIPAKRQLRKIMRLVKFIFVSAFIFLLAICVPAQTRPKSITMTTAANPLKATPAYAEVLLRKTDLEADLEDLLATYKEDFPKVKETRYELGLIEASLNKVLAVNPSESSKLTLALGKLLVRKAELDTNLWSLKNKYGDEHPDVKRASRKSAVFDKAVKEILP